MKNEQEPKCSCYEIVRWVTSPKQDESFPVYAKCSLHPEADDWRTEGYGETPLGELFGEDKKR